MNLSFSLVGEGPTLSGFVSMEGAFCLHRSQHQKAKGNVATILEALDAARRQRGN